VEGVERLDLTLALGSYFIGDPDSAGITISEEVVFGDGFEDASTEE
jgi:hypothetical protein